MINIFIEDKTHEKRIKYVFDYIFMVLGIKHRFIENIQEKNNEQDIKIIYGRKIFLENNSIYIKQSNKLFNEDYLKPIKYTVRKINDVVNLMADDELYIKNENNMIETNIDIVSDIFFLLTRYEEIVNEKPYKQEKFNRFPARESIMFKENILNRAIVNEHIEFIWSFINKMNLGYKKKKWWGDKEFAVFLSHDVDFVFRYRSAKNFIKPVVKTIIKDKSIEKMIKVIKNYIDTKIDYKKDPFYTFDYIMDIEKQCGFKSSFYFMTGGTSKFDNFYDINDKRVVNLIKQIEQDGFEVGYHCSFNSYHDIELMKREKEELDKVVTNKEYGCRQHFLRFKAPYTWRIQEKLRLKYDTTLSFADKEGFRSGTCFPFRPYDVLEDRVIDIWEIPLIVMEASLDNSDYSEYTPSQGYDKTVELIEVVRKYKGVFSLLWHNSTLDGYDSKNQPWILIYENILKYLSQNDVLNKTGVDLMKYLE